MAVAMAATPNVDVSAAPIKVVTDGREELHNHAEQAPNLFSFGRNLFRRLPLSDSPLLNRDVPWPKLFGLDKPAKIPTGGPEGLHAQEQHFLYFMGSDVWRHWKFAHTGALWSPAGLNNEGFTLKLLTNGGTYRNISTTLNNTTIIGRHYSASLQPGWRLKRGAFEVTVYAGYDLQYFRTYPIDPDARLLGRYRGWRATVELWKEPSEATMLAADASISSIGAGNHARIAYGWRLLDRFYLGPELQFYSTANYQHTRAGIHITAVKAFDREWSGAVGYASDNDHRSGLYVRISAIVRR